MEILSGYVKSHIFKSDKFCVVSLTTKGGFKTVRFSGSLSIPRIGGRYEFYGSTEVHRVYGEQFAAGFYAPELNSSILDCLQYYLPSQSQSFTSSLSIKYGLDLLKNLESGTFYDPVGLLTEDVFKQLSGEYNDSLVKLNLTKSWMGMGLNLNLLNKLWEKFGLKVTILLETSPYSLVREDPSVFPIVDKFVLTKKHDPDNSERVKALILAALYHACNNDGHMGIPSPELMGYIKNVYVKSENVEPVSTYDILPDRFYFEAVKDLIKDKSLEEEHGFLYSRDNLFFEEESAKSIRQRLSRKPLKFKDLDLFIKSYNEKSGIDLSEGQKKALKLVVSSKFVVITGFPGTGKTSVIDALVNWCRESNLSVSLMSPTGIAAKRLSQVTKTPASTVHRALGCDRDGNWTFDKHNKFKSDVIIVDEMSMVDARLFHRLTTSIDSSALLVLVGDPAQLPSVGSGDVLNQLSKCDKIPGVRLDKIYRQTGSSRITELAHEILSSSISTTETDLKSEVVFLPCSDVDCLAQVVELSGELKNREKQFQVLAPIYDSLLGVNNLNRSLRPVLNPESVRGSKYRLGGEEIYDGDRVIVIKNDYDRSIYNGDTGKIASIDLSNQTVRVKVYNWSDGSSPIYSDKFIDFNLGELEKYFKVAFATSVHRTQGNEYDYIILPMTFKYGIMLYKNLVYTAITRARKKVFIVGDTSAFLLSVRNERQTTRYSALSVMI